MRRVAAVAPLVAVAAVLTACGSATDSTSTPPSLDGTSWTLTQVGGAAAIPGGQLGFNSGKVSGSTGCNSFGGTYTQSGNSLTISLGPATLIGCPPALAKQEHTVLAALSDTSSFTLGGGVLTLKNAAGKDLLAYGHLGPSALLGTAWEVTGINNGKQAVSSPVAGSHVTATFGADGMVTGSSGCNSYHAAYTLTGDALHVGPVASTRKLCTNPPGVMEQEAAFVKALESSTSVEPGSGHFTLRDSGGAIQLTLAKPG